MKFVYQNILETRLVLGQNLRSFFEQAERFIYEVGKVERVFFAQQLFVEMIGVRHFTQALGFTAIIRPLSRPIVVEFLFLNVLQILSRRHQFVLGTTEMREQGLEEPRGVAHRPVVAERQAVEVATKE